MELLVATTNPGKFQELGALLKDLPLQIVSLTDLLDPPRVIEDGLTFEENALKKARALANFSGLLTLADDSGLEVDVLNGAPGIYSARYAGTECDDNKNNQKLLSELQSVTEDDRTARFVCALALCSPGLKAMPDWTVREVCEGRIAFSLQGKHGFGYDPLFFFSADGQNFR
jgi:XTP/dITP diphosphohydrolase